VIRSSFLYHCVKVPEKLGQRRQRIKDKIKNGKQKEAGGEKWSKRKREQRSDPRKLQICLCPRCMLELGTIAYLALTIGTSHGF